MDERRAQGLERERRRESFFLCFFFQVSGFFLSLGREKRMGRERELFWFFFCSSSAPSVSFLFLFFPRSTTTDISFITHYFFIFS